MMHTSFSKVVQFLTKIRFGKVVQLTGKVDYERKHHKIPQMYFGAISY